MINAVGKIGGDRSVVVAVGEIIHVAEDLVADFSDITFIADGCLCIELAIAARAIE